MFVFQNAYWKYNNKIIFRDSNLIWYFVLSHPIICTRFYVHFESLIDRLVKVCVLKVDVNTESNCMKLIFKEKQDVLVSTTYAAREKPCGRCEENRGF